MKNWFALYVQPRKEKVVEKELLRNNYEAFLPIKKCLRQWKDRKKMVEMPLIPSYVFVFIEVKDMWDILKINGCVKFVWFDKKPCPIPQYQIESLKLIQENEIDIELENNIRPNQGDMVKIIDGPFEGLVGVVKRGNKHNFAVRIDSLEVDILVVLEESNIIRAEKIDKIENN
ncbi:MAG: UpxY family transcription antiterminator [Bacteroidales bacterium]|nr:UpxY family transcription antiterminator [Bacteroidales bacterium]MDD4001451.1 UpxY family transcription antiterminator [Bacteroidales bacterium]MDD4529671.1 UpxY family transcription antiterminator [Bacteroidales bacterium]MDD4829390.1 UpxY family transcription antiterminator [Bacteroidales bacterium]